MTALEMKARFGDRAGDGGSVTALEMKARFGDSAGDGGSVTALQMKARFGDHAGDEARLLAGLCMAVRACTRCNAAARLALRGRSSVYAV